MPSWELYWGQNTCADNIAYRQLQVDSDVPVHGRVVPIAQALQDIQRMTRPPRLSVAACRRLAS